MQTAYGADGKAEDVGAVCLESVQLCASSGVPKLDNSHGVP